MGWGNPGVHCSTPQGTDQILLFPQWLEKGKRPISLSLPCSEEEFDAQRSTAFFDNLLPEEGMYRDLCREARLDEADIYNFLRLFGKECAGALVIAPEGAVESAQAPGLSGHHQ